MNHCFQSKSLPYRYFNNFLVLYTDFSASRQIGFLRISIAVGGLSHHELNGLFLHRKRLLFADHKESAIDFSMMIHCKALLTIFVFSNKNCFHWKESLDPVSRISLSHYSASRQDWKIHLHRGNHVWIAMVGLEPTYFGGSTNWTTWHTERKKIFWKNDSSSSPRLTKAIPRIRTGACWLKVNRSTKSYDSLSRFLHL